MSHFKLMLALLLPAITACQAKLTQPVLSETASPGLLIQNHSSQKEKVEAAVSQLLGNKPIILASDVFTEKSTLLVERTHHRDERGVLIDGRRIEQAIVFTLLYDRGVCWIRREDNSKSLALPDIKCVNN